MRGNVAESEGQCLRSAEGVHGHAGQAAVELALALPLVALLLLTVVQLGLLVRDQVLVVHAAREGARQAALGSTGLSSRGLTVSMSGRGGPGSHVRVEVRYRTPTDVPLVGAALGDMTLHASATMRVER